MKTEAAFVSKRVKKELKELFPKVKFSVKSENFSMGTSVDVYYTDFLPASVLEEYFGKYKAGRFDSSQDLYNYNKKTHELNENGVLEAIPRTQYLSFNREVSPGMRELAKQFILGKFDCSNKDESQIRTAVYRLTYGMDLSFGFDKQYAENYSCDLFDY